MISSHPPALAAAPFSYPTFGCSPPSTRRAAEIELPATTNAAPMTYMIDGVQFIVVAVGATGHPGELVALALPDAE